MNFRESDRKPRSSSDRYAPPKGAPIENKAEDAAFSSRESKPGSQRVPYSEMPSGRRRSTGNPDRNSTIRRTNSSNAGPRPRDNTSRFDD